jgi:hypothetical protein
VGGGGITSRYGPPKRDCTDVTNANWALLFCAILAAYGRVLAGSILWDDDGGRTGGWLRL